jgi:DNA-binding CsgD family transcriptional regulator
MPGPKAGVVIVTDEERARLRRLIKRHNVRQKTVKMAQLVLVTGEGKSNSQIMREQKFSIDMVRQWRQRCFTEVSPHVRNEDETIVAEGFFG